jgi:hypothetical protein
MPASWIPYWPNTWPACANGWTCCPAPGCGRSSISILWCARSTDTDKQGASYGHTKISGKQVLRKGLSPLVTTLSTDTAPPVVTGIRLRAGKANSGKGAARMVAQAITTARVAGVTGLIIVRGDSAYGSGAVIRTCLRYGAVFSLVLGRNAAVQRVIDAICQDAWTPVQYPGAVRDPKPAPGSLMPRSPKRPTPWPNPAPPRSPPG